MSQKKHNSMFFGLRKLEVSRGTFSFQFKGLHLQNNHGGVSSLPSSFFRINPRLV